MLPKRLLYISDRSARAYFWQKGLLTLEAEFENSDTPDLAAFENYLKQKRRTPLFIVADLIELDFRFETTPHVGLKDSRALRNRKLGSLYRITPFRNALFLGRESTGRRDDKILFSAITNADAFNPWMPIIQRLKVPLAGISASPILFAKHLRQEWPEGPVLLVTRSSTAGIRLTYFLEGELRFSRLALHFDDDPKALAAIVLEESARTQQYLISLKLIDRNQPLQILLADQAQFLSTWESNLGSTQLLRFSTIDLAALAQRAQISAFPAESTSIELQVGVAAKGFAPNQYAPIGYLHEAYLRLLRVCLHTGSIFLLLVGLLIMSLEAYDLWQLDRESRRYEAETAQLQAQYQKIKSSFPPAPAEAAHMRDSVEAIEGIMALRASSLKLMAIVAHALDGSPQLQVSNILWKYGNPEETVGSEGNTATPKAASNLPGEQAPSQWHALIEGELPATLRQRDALRIIDKFKDSLTAQGIKVVVLQLPYNVRPDSTLEGSSGEFASTETQHKPGFSIRIAWDSPPK